MRNRPNEPLPSASEANDDHSLKGASWEHDVALNALRSKTVAWRVASAAAGLVLVLGVAIALMIPLKSVVPMVVMVDKITGQAQVVSPARDFIATGELNEKHWVEKFVVSRERYVYKFLQFDYDTVRLTANDRTWSKYKPIYEGEDALDKRFRDEVEIIPTILSTTLNGDGLATVRYELRQRDFKGTTPPTVTRRVATLRYEFAASNLTLHKEQVANPFGFTVTEYQTDPEMGGEPQGGRR